MGLVLLLVIGVVISGTLIGRSFRAGLETAVLAWIAVYVCTVTVGITQAIAWYNAEGILLLDGEGAAGAGVDAIGAASSRRNWSSHAFPERHRACLAAHQSVHRQIQVRFAELG